MRVAVVGAGITGIACSRLLIDAGVQVTIFEKSNAKGGLVRCTIEKHDVLFHRVGGHVFNSKDQNVNNWFWGFFDKETEFFSAERRAVIYTKKRFANYPVENNLDFFGADQLRKIITELSEIIINKSDASLQQMHSNESNFKDFLLARFGKTLCDQYFFPYNKKIWNRDLDLIPLDWLAGKLPMPDPVEIITSNILKTNESEMVHSSFFYPKIGGSQFIVDRLSENINIKYNYNALPEIMADGVISVDGDIYDKVIYTGDLRHLLSSFKSGQLDHSFDAAIKALPSNSTSNLLCKCDQNPYSWVYLPDTDVDCHRIIMTGNFSPSNNGSIPLNEGKVTCTVEFSGEYSYKEMSSQLINLPFNMEPLSHNIEQSSYIVHTMDTSHLVSKIRSILEPKNIYLCGRFADWQYYNMDAAIFASMKLVQKIKAEC